MVIITGVYKHEHDENFNELLEKGGVNFLLRKIITKISPTIKLESTGEETYVLTTSTPIKTLVWSIKLGETRSYDTPEGLKKFLFTKEDGDLVQTPIDQGKLAFKVIRRFVDDTLTVDVIHEESGTRAKRFFKKAE